MIGAELARNGLTRPLITFIARSHDVGTYRRTARKGGALRTAPPRRQSGRRAHRRRAPERLLAMYAACPASPPTCVRSSMQHAARNEARPRPSRPAPGGGDSEVDRREPGRLVRPHVRRLEVPMHDSGVVRRGYAASACANSRRTRRARLLCSYYAFPSSSPRRIPSPRTGSPAELPTSNPRSRSGGSASRSPVLPVQAQLRRRRGRGRTHA